MTFSPDIRYSGFTRGTLTGSERWAILRTGSQDTQTRTMDGDGGPETWSRVTRCTFHQTVYGNLRGMIALQSQSPRQQYISTSREEERNDSAANNPKIRVKSRSLQFLLNSELKLAAVT